MNWLLAVKSSIPRQLDDKVRYPQAPYSTQVAGRTSLRQLIVENIGSELQATNVSSGSVTIYIPMRSIATAQPVVIADALVNTAVMWADAVSNAKPAKGHGSAFSDQQDAVHNIIGYYQPYVETMCGLDAIDGANDQAAVFFPILPGSDPNLGNATIELLGTGEFAVPAMEYGPLRKSQLLDLPGSVLQNRFKWVEIPQRTNDPDAKLLGLVVLQP